MFFILFLLVSFPFVLTLLLPGSYEKTAFSIYNTGDKGLSEFKELLNFPENPIGSDNKTVEVKTLISSTNALLRLEKTPAALVIMGPTLHFDPSESLALLTYLAAGGRVLIVDDFGTANDLLMLINMILEYFKPFEMLTEGIEGEGDLGAADSVTGGLLDIISKIVGIHFGAGSNGSLLLDTESYRTGPAEPVFKKSNLQEEILLYMESADTIYVDTASVLGMAIPGLPGEAGGVYSFPSSNLPFPAANPYSMTFEGGTTGFNPLLRSGTTYWEDVDEVLGNFASSLFLTLDDNGKKKPWPVPSYLSVLASSEYFYMEKSITSAVGQESEPTQGQNEFAGSAGGYAQTTGTIKGPTGDPLFYTDEDLTQRFDAYLNLTVKASTFFTLPLGAPGDGNAGSLTLCSDPSIFSNGLLEIANNEGYDNPAFARNVIWELLYGRFGDDWASDSWLASHGYEEGDVPIVVVDEAHLAHDPVSPMLFLGFYLRFLDLMTMFPLLAPLIPITVVLYSRKFVPKRAAPKPILLTKVERYYGRSFFAIKMRWFLEYQQFARGLELLTRHFRRQVIRHFSYDGPLDPQSITTLFLSEFSDLNEKEILNGFNTIEEITSHSLVIEEEEFLNWHLFLKGLLERIS